MNKFENCDNFVIDFNDGEKSIHYDTSIVNGWLYLKRNGQLVAILSKEQVKEYNNNPKKIIEAAYSIIG